MAAGGAGCRKRKTKSYDTRETGGEIVPPMGPMMGPMMIEPGVVPGVIISPEGVAFAALIDSWEGAGVPSVVWIGTCPGTGATASH